MERLNDSVSSLNDDYLGKKRYGIDKKQTMNKLYKKSNNGASNDIDDNQNAFLTCWPVLPESNQSNNNDDEDDDDAHDDDNNNADADDNNTKNVNNNTINFDDWIDLQWPQVSFIR